MASPVEARSSANPPPVPDHPGPLLRLEHSSDQAQRAADVLAARWERFERGRRWRLFLLVPGLILAAAACPILDVAMGFHVPLATWYAPILIVTALLARSATRPAGRAGRPRRLRHWWAPPVWRRPLASCRQARSRRRGGRRPPAHPGRAGDAAAATAAVGEDGKNERPRRSGASGTRERRGEKLRAWPDPRRDRRPARSSSPR